MPMKCVSSRRRLSFPPPRVGPRGGAQRAPPPPPPPRPPPQGGTFAVEVVREQVTHVDVRGTERAHAFALPVHLHAHVGQQTDEVVHVQDVGQVADGDGVGE